MTANGTSRILRAEVNVPLELAYRDAEPVQGQYGDQVKYTLVDGRYFYLDVAVAAKVDALGIQPGQPFTLLKRKEGKTLQWQISRGAGVAPPAPASPANNGPVATYVHQNTRNGHGELAVPAVNGNGTQTGGGGRPPAAPGPAVHQGDFQYLIQQSQGLIDAYGALLAYSEQQHGNRIKPDDVRALLTTTFIQIQGKR